MRLIHTVSAEISKAAFLVGSIPLAPTKSFAEHSFRTRSYLGLFLFKTEEG